MTTPVLVEIDDSTVAVTVATESVVLEGVGAVGPPGATGATGADSTVPGPQGVPGEPGTTLHAELTDTTADDHHDQDHAARHGAAGADPVTPAAIGAEPAGTVATHSADTTSVHGIADTSVLATDAEVATAVATHAATPHGTTHPDLAAHDALGLATQSELETHAADTTSVHGIADTSALALTSHDHDGDYDALGAAAEAVAALVDSSPSTLDTLNELAVALGDDPNFATTVTTALGTKATTAALTAHESDTTAIHGITDTSALETTTGSAAKVAAHESDTSVHGIADTTVLATDAEVTAAVAAHAAAGDPHTGYATEGDLTTHVADTTSVHGIADTSVLETTTGSAAKITTHEAAANPHPDYTTTAELATHATDVAAHTTVATNRQTASYTLVLADAGKVVEQNVASANNLTVPLNSSVAFAVGTVIELWQYGAGQTTVVATGGVTIRSSGGKLKLTGQYSGASLRKIATDEWSLVGDIAT